MRHLRLMLALTAAGVWTAGGLAVGQPAQPPAQPVVDPHRIWEERCASCHDPHMATFARDRAVLRDGKAVGRKSGADLAVLLERHRGTRQTAPEVSALLDAFRRMLSSGPIFQEKCIVCHDNAKVLARDRLALKDGRLVGRFTNVDVAELLAHHGRLEAAEVPKVVEMLRWQLTTKEP